MNTALLLTLLAPREMMTNPGFDSATGWTAETGWSISGGAASYSRAYNAGFTNLYQVGQIQAGRTYQFRANISAICDAANGAFSFRLGPSQYSAIPNATGLVVANIVASVSGGLLIGMAHVAGGSSGTATITVDSFSVRRVK